MAKNAICFLNKMIFFVYVLEFMSTLAKMQINNTFM